MLKFPYVSIMSYLELLPMLGFKSFHSAEMTITGIENISMIQKRQIIGANDNLSTF